MGDTNFLNRHNVTVIIVYKVSNNEQGRHIFAALHLKPIYFNNVYMSFMKGLLLRVPRHRRRRWLPCDARAFCPL